MVSNQSENLLERVRIASPCHMSWDEMAGDERKRFCKHCNLHVYNFSAMTKREAEELVTKTEGRLCTRLYRRTDGTVLTKDCPVGLKALRRRLKMRVGVFLSALFGLSLTAFGQEQKATDKGQKEQIEITRTVDTTKNQHQLTTLTGTVYDENRGVIQNAKITLINEEKKTVAIATTNDEGLFVFPQLESGSYSLQVEATWFKTFNYKNFNINENEFLNVSLTLIIKDAEMRAVEAHISHILTMDEIQKIPITPKKPK